MTWRVYLVDDEALALTRLGRLLEATGRVEIVGRSTSPVTAIAELATAPAELVFLDISMPVLDGFEVCARLPSHLMVVFTTAHDEHALRAFQVAAVDYLLKPIRAEALTRTLDRLDARRAGPAAVSAEALGQALQRIVAVGAQLSVPPARIASRIGDRIQFIDLDAVSHFIAEHKLTHAVTAARTHVVDATIAELERRYPTTFVRIHRGTLVRLAAIVELHATASGARVRLDTGHQLPVARDRIQALRAQLATLVGVEPPAR